MKIDYSRFCTRYQRIIRILLISVVVSVGVGVRLVAANHLPVDFDEPVYLKAALGYTNSMRSGQWTQIAWNETNMEHPVFYKIIYGAALLTQAPLDQLQSKDLGVRSPIETAGAKPWAMMDRYISVIFVSLAVLILALFNPLAGLLLGIDSLSVKYTSVIYLEALPLLTSLLSVICYQRWFEGQKLSSTRSNKLWLAGSALFLGITAASKYLYCVVGLAIVIHALFAVIHKNIKADKLVWVGLWGLIALTAFFVFDPYLWPHPLERLLKSLTFLVNYQSLRVGKVHGYSIWQPLIWLSAPYSHFTPATSSALVFKLDTLITLFALIGLSVLFKRQPLYFIWLVVGLLVLLSWTTKSTQYVLIILVPYCISAAEGLRWFLRFTWQKLVRLRRSPVQE